MSNILFKTGKQNIGNKAIAFNADTFKASLLTMSSAAGKIALISSSTNASPIVVTTSAAHGYSTGDIVVVGGHTTNTAANGTWQLGTVASTTFQLLTLLDGNNSTGNGVGGATGWAIDITTAAVLSDVSANSNGTDVSLSGVTNTGGVINSSSWTWTGLSATKSWAIAIYDSTASNDLIAWIDGTFQLYVVTQAAAAATAIAVQRLPVVLPNAQAIVFSDGASATLSAQANVGDTSLTVSSLAAIVHRQATADAGPTGTGATAAGLPMTPGAGGSLQFTPDSGVNKLFVI
jgi:hypothetical protein